MLPLILLVVTTSFDLKTGSSGEKVVADVIDHGPLRELWVALSRCLDCPGSVSFARYRAGRPALDISAVMAAGQLK